MATTAILNFEKTGDVWAAKFTSQGSCVIELERNTQGIVSISANLSGMVEVPVTDFKNGYTPNVIFEVDVPEGVEVTVRSGSEVTQAKMLA